MDNYERVKVIGRGAFGTVYLCRRLADSRLVIIKQIPVEQLNKLDRQATVNEVRVLAMLDHPNIISYYESFLQDQAMMIVMEYAGGGTLHDFIESRTDFVEEDEIAHLFAQIVLPMKLVHARQVLHRDLKTQNIFLTSNRDHVKIGDFGISKILSSKSKAYTVVGTPCYISPELCEGKPYNQKSDVWAMGCILYELCALKRAFEAPTLPALVLKIMRGNYHPLPAHCSSSVRDLVSSLLALDPAQRPTLAQVTAHHWLAPHLYRLATTLGALPCAAAPPRPLTASKFNRFISFKPFARKEQRASPFSPAKKTSFILVWDSMTQQSPKRLEPPSTAEFVSVASARQRHLLAATSDGKVHEFKDDKRVPLDGLAGVVVSSVVASGGGGFHCLLTDRGILLTVGRGGAGCLGHGDTRDVRKPKIVEALLGEEVVRVACGERHVCAVTSDGDVFAWGEGKGGCLGLGEVVFASKPEKVEVKDAVVDVACGQEATLLRTRDGRVMAAGRNNGNRFGLKHEGGVIDRFVFAADKGKASMVALAGDCHMLAVAEDCRSAVVYGGDRRKAKVKLGKGKVIDRVEGGGGDCFALASSQGEIFLHEVMGGDKGDEVSLLQQPFEKEAGTDPALSARKTTTTTTTTTRLAGLSLSQDGLLSALFV